MRMDLTPEKGEFLFLTLAEFKEQICCFHIFTIYMIHPLMTKKVVLLFSFILLASCWELEALDEVPCTDGYCKECDAETNTTCVRCDPAFYIDDINSKCTLCSHSIPHCFYCSLKGTEVECSQCKSKSYYLINPGQCKACSEVIPGCISCHPSTSDFGNSLSRQLFDAKAICETCSGTLWPTADGSTCKECGQQIEHCAQCSQLAGSSLQCKTCGDGYGTDDTMKKCETCDLLIEHCTNCSRANITSPLKCGTCEEGYELNEDKTKCEEKSSSTAIIIISVVGGIVVIGAGIVAWKMCQKKKKLSTLLDQGDNDE